MALPGLEALGTNSRRESTAAESWAELSGTAVRHISVSRDSAGSNILGCKQRSAILHFLAGMPWASSRLLLWRASNFVGPTRGLHAECLPPPSTTLHINQHPTRTPPSSTYYGDDLYAARANCQSPIGKGGCPRCMLARLWDVTFNAGLFCSMARSMLAARRRLRGA